MPMNVTERYVMCGVWNGLGHHCPLLADVNLTLRSCEHGVFQVRMRNYEPDRVGAKSTCEMFKNALHSGSVILRSGARIRDHVFRGSQSTARSKWNRRYLGAFAFARLYLE